MLNAGNGRKTRGLGFFRGERPPPEDHCASERRLEVSPGTNLRSFGGPFIVFGKSPLLKLISKGKGCIHPKLNLRFTDIPPDGAWPGSEMESGIEVFPKLIFGKKAELRYFPEPNNSVIPADQIAREPVLP